MRRGLLGVILALALAAPAVAGPDPAEARTLVIRTTEQVLEAVRAERERLAEDPSGIYPIIERFVLPHFDFQAMARYVLGIYWRRATPAQRERFTEAFTRLLVRTYGTALAKYRDERIVYAPVQAAPGATDVTVRAEVEQPGGFPISIDYRLHYRDGAWKVYDVAVDDLSLVANYRTTFRGEIRREGLDALIARLERRAAAAGGG